VRRPRAVTEYAGVLRSSVDKAGTLHHESLPICGWLWLRAADLNHLRPLFYLERCAPFLRMPTL